MVAAPPSATAAGRLAEFCAGLRWAELDGEVQARTRELLLDLIDMNKQVGIDHKDAKDVARAYLQSKQLIR